MTDRRPTSMSEDRHQLIEAALKEADELLRVLVEVPHFQGWQGEVRRVRGLLAALPAEPVRATDPLRAALRRILMDARPTGWPDMFVTRELIEAGRVALAADREPEPVEITDEMARKVLVQLLMRSPNGLTEASVKEALAAALSEPQGESNE